MLRAGIDSAISRRATLDYQAYLRQPVDTGGFSEQYRSITVSDLSRMVTALTQQRIVSSRLSLVLNRDLRKAQSATRSRRARAIRKFRKDLLKLRGGYSGFLRYAAVPLSR
jgi:hypothetical protein